ncbi:hypothetical protein ACQEV2_33200 [Streptomyces sp. CA-251387]|uniref:hypothetical protein n=1 Tax=Streptomyces sp. CA-251387 TaxID=3240064 RepID=UPI003D8C3928
MSVRVRSAPVPGSSLSGTRAWRSLSAVRPVYEAGRAVSAIAQASAAAGIAAPPTAYPGCAVTTAVPVGQPSHQRAAGHLPDGERATGQSRRRQGAARPSGQQHAAELAGGGRQPCQKAMTGRSGPVRLIT